MALEVLPLGNGEVKTRPKLKVVGIGGAGCNAITNSSFDAVGICRQRSISNAKASNHTRLALEPDELETLRATPHRILTSTKNRTLERIKYTIGNSDMVFIFTGLGGEFGSGLTSAIAHSCREISQLVVVSTTIPFSVEGTGRKEVASKALPAIINSSDLTITYPNDGLLAMAPELPIHKAFRVMDSIMMIPPVELAEVLTKDDIAILREESQHLGALRMGMGYGVGMRRGEMAAFDALTSPWFDFSLKNVFQRLLQ